MSASGYRKTLFPFCSNGVKSGVMKMLHTGSGLSLGRSLSLCLRILALSWVELSQIFKSLDLSDRLPKQIAFWIVTVTPKCFWNNDLHFSFLEGPPLAEDSSRLCRIILSCLFSFSFCSALIEMAMLATDSSVIGGTTLDVLVPSVALWSLSKVIIAFCCFSYWDSTFFMISFSFNSAAWILETDFSKVDTLESITEWLLKHYNATGNTWIREEQKNTILGILRLAITLHCSLLNLEQLACWRFSHHIHSRILLVAGLEHTWHLSPLAFFASLLAGELAGCLCLVGSIAIPINQHLDSKKAQRNEQNNN